jgi:hypothetical protein
LAERLRIAGVAGDVRSAGLVSEAQPEAFVSYRQIPDMMTLAFAGFGVTIVGRAEGDPLALVAPLRREVLASDPELPLDDVKTMAVRLSASVAEPRFYAAIIGAFAMCWRSCWRWWDLRRAVHAVSQRHRRSARMAPGARGLTSSGWCSAGTHARRNRTRPGARRISRRHAFP